MVKTENNQWSRAIHKGGTSMGIKGKSVQRLKQWAISGSLSFWKSTHTELKQRATIIGVWERAI